MENNEYTYKIGRVTYSQEELTWGQDKKIVALYNKAMSKLSGNDNITLAAIPELLIKYDLIGEFFGIFLQPYKNMAWYMDRLKFYFKWILGRRRGTWKQLNMDAAGNKQIEQMFDDFFLLNRKLIEKLSSLGNGLSMIAKTLKENPEKIPSSNTSQTTESAKPKKKTKKQPPKRSNITARPGIQPG